MLLDILGSTLFCISAYLTYERYAVGVRVILKHLEQILKVESHYRVTAHTDGCGLTHTCLSEVVDHLIGQRTTAAYNSSVTFLEYVCRHDSHEALTRAYQSGAVRSYKTGTLRLDICVGISSIYHRHTFSDAHYEFDATVGGLEHGVLGKCGRNEYYGCVSASGFDSVFHGIEYWYAVHLLSGLAW